MHSLPQQGSNNLGISGKSTNPAPKNQGNQQLVGAGKSRFHKYALSRKAGSILFDTAKPAAEQHRTCWCHRGVVRKHNSVSIFRHASGNSARMAGVTTCKSVWTCPICSGKICAARQAELTEGMAAWVGQGGYVYLMTLTFPHELGTPLMTMLPAFSKAKSSFKNSKTYKRILAKGLRAGSVSSLEVTLGEHGWHPHQHDLVFATPDVFGETKELEHGRLSSRAIDELKEAWYMALRKAGLCEQSQMSDVLAHGLDVRGGQFAAEYIAKFGHDQKWGLSREVTMHAAKMGADTKGAHPFQLLAWADEGDGLAVEQFREYAEAFEGKRMLSWTRGLKKRLTGADEMTEEEAAATAEAVEREQPDEARVGIIDGEALSVIQARHLLPNFLQFVAENCSDPDTSQAQIDEYMALAREIVPRGARGTVKRKMHCAGFEYRDLEVAA